MLPAMWAFPLAAAALALAFASLLLRQLLARRRSHQAFWAIALLMYAAASLALFLGVVDGWTSAEYRVYWLFGAVLNVPFLAQGEIQLLVRSRAVTAVLGVLLVFGTAFALARVRTAQVDPAALIRDLPLGREVFRNDPFALDLARYFAFPAYFILLAGTLWSALRVRRAPELRNRFLGTLGIAIGATIVAAGSAFAATGRFVGFSITLTVGIGVMFWGFLRASRPGLPHTQAGPPKGVARST